MVKSAIFKLVHDLKTHFLSTSKLIIQSELIEFSKNGVVHCKDVDFLTENSIKYIVSP